MESALNFLLFKKFYFSYFRGMGREEEKQGEKH